MPNARLRDREAWRVRIPAHRIWRTGVGGVPTGEVYEVPERVSVRFETSSRAAIVFAVHEAHVDAGIPPWMPYFRQSERLAMAEACVWRPETASAE